jgi:hypothetical protein
VERFGLTRSEVKSIFTVSYKMPEFAHLRKDTRRRDSWHLDETLFLIRHAGIQPRSWISKKLKRGGIHSVKEQLYRLNGNSKYMNGIPRGWLLRIMNAGDCPAGIKTKAGPTGCPKRNCDFRFRIVPWTVCEKLIKQHPRRFSPELKHGIRAMAKFQRWIHGVSNVSLRVKRLADAA